MKSKTTRKKATPKVDAAAKAVESIEDLLELLKIETWDYLLVGDGSCTGAWKYEMGYASTLIERATYTDPTDWMPFWGTGNLGTNIVAELMAYVLPLQYLAATTTLSLKRVHIVTDCEHLLYGAKNPSSRKKNRELWLMVDALKRRGLITTWHWIPRDTINLNKFGHELANAARKAIKGLDRAVLDAMDVENLKDLNPHEPSD